MREKIPCTLIRDLAPLYVEGLVCEETRDLVEEHMGGCQECREHCETLAKGIEKAEEKERSWEKMEIDSMKRIRRYQRRNLILGACVSFLLGAFLPIVLIGISVVGRGGISAYQLARLQVAWHIILFKMLFWGLLACAGYLLVNRLFMGRSSCKKSSG